MKKKKILPTLCVTMKIRREEMDDDVDDDRKKRRKIELPLLGKLVLHVLNLGWNHLCCFVYDFHCAVAAVVVVMSLPMSLMLMMSSKYPVVLE